jgi:hypothetical protein
VDETAGWTEDGHAAVRPVDVHGVEDLSRIDAHTRARPREAGAVDHDLQAESRHYLRYD